MIGDYKLVWYDEYCPSCVHRDLCETEEPCNECLTECAVIDSHKPIKYERDESYGKPDYSSLIKLQDYMFEMHYDTLDYNYAKNYFRTHTPDINQFGCSCVRRGNLYGRNYDWYYDNYPTIIVHTPVIGTRHASLAVCQGFRDLTERFVESKTYSELYRVLPFIALDGINDAGVVCNVNVVPAGDWGATTGTTPAIRQREELSVMMLNRYVLDNFSTAAEAVKYLHDYCSIYSYAGMEYHFMIADGKNTYIVEFLDNRMRVIDSTIRPYMTNFYIKNSVFNTASGLVERTSLTPHGSGVERYELIAMHYDTLDSVENMANFLHRKLKYTNSYDESVNPFWYTELVGNYETFGDLTVLSPESAFDGIKEYTIGLYKDRNREVPNTWQTVHTVVYDMEEKSMYIIPQEAERSMHKIIF